MARDAPCIGVNALVAAMIVPRGANICPVHDTRKKTVLRWPNDDDLYDWFADEAQRRDVSLNHLLIASARRYRQAHTPEA